MNNPGYYLISWTSTGVNNMLSKFITYTTQLRKTRPDTTKFRYFYTDTEDKVKRKSLGKAIFDHVDTISAYPARIGGNIFYVTAIVVLLIPTIIATMLTAGLSFVTDDALSFLTTAVLSFTGIIFSAAFLTGFAITKVIGAIPALFAIPKVLWDYGYRGSALTFGTSLLITTAALITMPIVGGPAALASIVSQLTLAAVNSFVGLSLPTQISISMASVLVAGSSIAALALLICGGTPPENSSTLAPPSHQHDTDSKHGTEDSSREELGTPSQYSYNPLSNVDTGTIPPAGSADEESNNPVDIPQPKSI